MARIPPDGRQIGRHAGLQPAAGRGRMPGVRRATIRPAPLVAESHFGVPSYQAAQSGRVAERYVPLAAESGHWLTTVISRK
jgi:hypothetical protein